MADDGFEDWYRREHPRLLSSLTAITADLTLATEATDEALARAYERWPRVRRMASPGGWTYRTALNVARRLHRRRAMEATLLRRNPPAGDVQPPADWSAEVWDALRSLPQRERTAVVLRHVADLSTADIAAVMKVAPGTVASTLHAGRSRLARLLTDPTEVHDG